MPGKPRGTINWGSVTRVSASEGVWVEVIDLGRGHEFGPLPTLGIETLESGDRVIVASIGGIYDDLVVLGKVTRDVVHTHDITDTDSGEHTHDHTGKTGEGEMPNE